MNMNEKKRTEPTYEEISQLAYHIFLNEGCPHGRDLEHWEQAKAILTAARQPKSSDANPKAKKR
jgi:hypothetical protein